MWLVIKTQRTQTHTTGSSFLFFFSLSHLSAKLSIHQFFSFSID